MDTTDLNNKSSLIPIRTLKNPVTFESERMELPEGLTIAEMVDIAVPERALHKYLFVTISGHEIPFENWHLVKPKENTLVVIRLIPRGGDSNKILRSVLLIAITAAAIYIGGPAGVSLFGEYGAIIAAAAVAGVGFYLVNMLVPPSVPKLDNQAGLDRLESRSIAGSRNAVNPYGVVPKLFGVQRVIPPFAANPYNELVGNDVYVRELFAITSGPANVYDMKIGDTAIEAYENVEIEVTQGYPSRPQNFINTDVDAAGNSFLIDNHQYLENQFVTFTSTGQLPGGLVSNPRDIQPSNVQTSSDSIVVSGHGLVNDQAVSFESTGEIPGGIREKSIHYVLIIDQNTIQLKKDIAGPVIDITSRGNGKHIMYVYYSITNPSTDSFQISRMIGGNVFDVTSQGSGTHTVKRHVTQVELYPNDVFQENLAIELDVDLGWVVRTTAPNADEIGVDFYFPEGLLYVTNDGKRNQAFVDLEIQFGTVGGDVAKNFTSSGVNVSSNVITISNHGFSNGMNVLLFTTGILPAPFVEGTQYFIINATTNTFQLATTSGGSVVDITSVGSGTQSIKYWDWSAGAIGKNYDERLVGPFIRDERRTVSGFDREQQSNIGTRVYHYERSWIVYIDRDTGAVKTVQGGRSTISMTVSGKRYNGFVPKIGRAPVTPENGIPLAKITLSSKGTDKTVQTSSITDLRPAGAPFGSASDFEVTANLPTNKKVTVGSGTLFKNKITVTGKSADQQRHGVKLHPEVRGQYDVRVRVTDMSTGNNVFNKTIWNTLKTITNEPPFDFDGLTTVALRIKASEQLYGAVDSFSCIAEAIIPELDYNLNSWIPAITSNPAACVREVLQGLDNLAAIEDDRVDIENLEDFHDHCGINSFTFNLYVDYQTTVQELLKDMAAAGRASYGLTPSGKWGVIIDRKQTTYAQHFNPRNSYDFSGSIVYFDLPNAIRLRFLNEKKDWEVDERIVYGDGFNESNAETYEELELTGVTDPDLAWRHGRFHFAQAILRPEQFVFSADIEHISCTRGDWIKLSHDVPAIGIAFGRLTNASFDSNGDLVSIRIDDPFEMQLGRDYSVRIRLPSGETAFGYVQTRSGYQQTLYFDPVADLSGINGVPEAGDLYSIGLVDEETIDAMVITIEPQNNETAKLTCVPASPEVHDADVLPVDFETSDVDVDNDVISIVDNQFADGDLVEFTTTNTLPNGLVESPLTFPSTDIDTNSDVINYINHNLQENQLVKFQTTGYPPGGLDLDTYYYAVDVTTNAFSLAKSFDGEAIDLTSQGTEDHVLVPAYYIVNSTSNNVQVALTEDGSPIDFSDQGTGTHTITRLVAVYESVITLDVGPLIPEIVDVRSDSTVLILDADGSWKVRILITINTDDLSAAIIGIEAQYRNEDSTAPFALTEVADISTGQISIYNVEPGQTYDYRLRFVFKEGERGDWSSLYSEFVIGKDDLPEDVSNFTAGQVGDAMNFRWTAVANLDLDGYIIKYGRPGETDTWNNATTLTEVTRGTSITNAHVPPGEWVFLIKAVDTSKNESENAASFTAKMTLVFSSVTYADGTPRLPNFGQGTGTGFVKRYDGSLAPNSQETAQTTMDNDTANNGYDLFDKACVNPVAQSIYEADEIDLDFDDTVLVWADINSFAAAGEASDGEKAHFEVDYKLDGGSYDGFEQWGVAALTTRYVKGRLLLNNVEGKIRFISASHGFKVYVDKRELSDGQASVTVGASGTAIEFAQPFHLPPRIIVNNAEGSAKIPGVDNVTSTGFMAHVYDTNGTEVGGTIDWQATGV